MSDKTIENIERHFDIHANFWVDVYGGAEKWHEFNSIGQREKVALRSIVGEHKGVAVDLGCGSGHALIQLKRLGFEKVIGVDISCKLVAAAKELIEKAGFGEGIEVIKGDVENLDMIESDTVDTVIALGLIEYLDDDASLLSEINRILKLGGAAIIQTRNHLCINTRTREFIKKTLSIKNDIRFRGHNPTRFRENLKKAGFEIEDERYSHYYPLFPLNLIPGVSQLVKPFNNYLSKKCEILSSSKVSRFLASMYIVKVRKTTV